MQGNGLDLSTLDVKTGADRGFKLELRHVATGAPLGLWIHILGADSDAYQEQMREFRRRAEDRLRHEQRSKLTDEESEQQSLEILVATTRGWSENMKLDGALLPFSPENARKLYSDKRFPWIPDQIHRNQHNRANFLPGNETSS